MSHYEVENFMLIFEPENLIILIFCYIKVKSRLSVCLSVHLSVCTFWHTDSPAVSAQIEMGLA